MKQDEEIVAQRFSWLGKLYVWSVVFEPLLYFVIVSAQPTIGVGGNWSRFLQLLLLILLGAKLSLGKSVIILNPFNSIDRKYSYFLILAIISGCFGLLTGEYELNQNYEYSSIYTSAAAILLGSQLRPFIEFFITIYYFLYFVVLPRYLLSSPAGINYFFKIFFRLFILSFLIGMIDLLLVYFTGIDGMSRQLGEGKYPGVRFHGLAGEPRDAFVYLVLGLAMFLLRDIWRDEKQLTKFKIILIFCATLLTQSASGFAGMIFSGILIIIFYIPRVSPKVALISFLVFSGVAVIVTFSALNSYRMMLYWNAFETLYGTLESGEKVTTVASVVMNNIYPVWVRWKEMLDFNFLPLVFGGGFGSASVVNNNFMPESGILNPNSNMVRLVYENGVLGLYMFICAFLVPIRKLCFKKHDYINLTLVMLLLLGAFLGHRSACLYIFLGITIVVLQSKIRDPQIRARMMRKY